MAVKARLLLSYWVKLNVAGFDAVFSTDFSTHGWWMPIVGNDIFVSRYPTPTNNHVADGVVNNTWTNVGVFFTAGGCRTYKNSVETVNVANSDLPLAALTLQAAVEKADILIAEIGIFIDNDLDTSGATVVEAILAKLADPMNAQRRAIDITDSPCAFYAPLLPGGSDNDLVASEVGTASGNLISSSDHPWTPPAATGAARRLTQGIPLKSLVGGGLVG